MEQQLAPAELLRFLQAEAETLQQMQSKISNELHNLQVEEDVYARTLDRLNQNAASNESNCANGGATNSRHEGGVQLLEALQQELTPEIPPVSVLPPDCALPRNQLAITAPESEGGKTEPQAAAPSGLGNFGDEYEEYELLDALDL